MAWRIGEAVVRGELDNRVYGKVTGRIWLKDRERPLELELAGNPSRDWAGCLLRFNHSNPIAADLAGLEPEQVGVCGDMTVSRKVRITPEPVGEWLAKGAPGARSLPWGNCVYLEWFSETNGRLVIESPHYNVELSERSWNMTEHQEIEQHQRNIENMNRFMTRLGAAIHQTANADEDELTNEDTDAELAEDEQETDRALELIFEIEAMKRKARELVGGEMIEGSGQQIVPLDIQHQFWQNVLATESAPYKLRREILAEAGFRAPAPNALTDQEVTAHLWRLINALAERRIFIFSTNHLSDRELYTLLVEAVLEEEMQLLPSDAGWSCRICIHEYGAPGDEDGSLLYLRYYADEATRAHWVQEFQEEIPPHCDPPFDRDRHLPSD
jgi:hypothetical protein